MAYLSARDAVVKVSYFCYSPRSTCDHNAQHCAEKYFPKTCASAVVRGHFKRVVRESDGEKLSQGIFDAHSSSLKRTASHTSTVLSYIKLSNKWKVLDLENHFPPFYFRNEVLQRSTNVGMACGNASKSFSLFI